MIGDRETIARMQSDFYQRKYHKFLLYLLLSVGLMLFLIAVIIYLVLTEPNRKYYVETEDGKILPLQVIK